MRCWLARFLALVVSILIGAASVRTAAGLFSRLQSVVDLSWARAITADLLWPREARWPLSSVDIQNTGDGLLAADGRVLDCRETARPEATRLSELKGGVLL